MSERTRLVMAIAAAAVALGFFAQALSHTFENLLVERAGRGRDDAIEVEVTNLFPGPNDHLELRVTNKIYYPDPLVLPGAIASVDVRTDGQSLQQSTFVRGRTATVIVRSPFGFEVGRVPLQVHVGYELHSGRPMRASRDATVVDLDVEVYDASARFWGQLRIAGQAWGFFLLWFVVVVVVARGYRRAAPGRHTTLDVVGLVVAVGGGAAVGDILFGRPLLLSFGVDDFDTRGALMLVWVGLPLMWLWVQAHRRPATAPWLPGARARQRTR